MVGRLASKVVIVTGGASGIGRAVAGRVVSEGATVVIGGRRREVGEQAAAEMRSGGGRALFIATDVTVERDVERLVARPWLNSASWTARSTTPAARTPPGQFIPSMTWHGTRNW